MIRYPTCEIQDGRVQVQYRLILKMPKVDQIGSLVVIQHYFDEDGIPKPYIQKLIITGLRYIFCLLYIYFIIMIIQNMITNQDQNTSSSLDIVQPQNRITFMDSSSSQSFDMSYDKDLDYSKDQSSLSFQIEDQKKFIHKDNIIVDTILSNQPPKRFRKQIFDKYKAPAIIKQQQVKHNVLNIQTENNIMKAFDQIFTSKGTPKSLKNIQFQSKNKKEQENLLILGKQISMKKIDKKILTSQFITNQPILQSQQKQKKNKQYSSKTNSPQIFKSNQFFKTPLDLSTQKIVETSNNRHQNFNLSQLQYRLSVIEGGDQIDFSRDSSDIADFLNAQIFQQKNSLRITTQNSTKDKIQQKKQIVHINQVFKTQSQQDIALKINIPISQTTNLNLPNQNLNINNQQNLQQSRFSDVYQRIDMTQSTVNASVVMKNSRFPIFGNNLNFIGNNDTSTISRMFTKTNSLGFIPIQQQEQTIINSLSSQKIIQQAAQDPRVPIFMRKAVKLNSTIPNFLSPTVQSNIDTQNEKLQQIIKNFSQVISFLNKILQQIRLKQQKRKEILHSFANGITLHKFKNSNWQICMQTQGIQKIKPKQNFIARSWNDMKVQLALQNYQKITQSHRGIKINLKDQRGIKKYWQIREKYNQIQKNLILISNDMYTQMLCLTFPQHYTQFKQILQQQQELFTKAQIHKKQIKLEHYLRLRNKNDELCSSQVGTILITKLTNQIKFNSAYF